MDLFYILLTTTKITYKVIRVDMIGNIVDNQTYFFSNNVILKAFISCIDKVSLQKKNMKRNLIKTTKYQQAELIHK